MELLPLQHRPHTIRFNKDSGLHFINPKTKRHQFYYSDMCKGDKLPVNEIYHATPSKLFFTFDGEICVVNLDDVDFIQ